MYTQKNMVIVVIGAAGTGRHTQGYMLMRKWGLTHIALRDLIYAAVEEDSDLGREMAPDLERGAKIPDKLVFELLNRHLSKVNFDKGVVINGFPVTMSQLTALQSSLGNLGIKIDHAVLLEVPLDESIRRLSGRRNCPSCHVGYHTAYKPPSVDGYCDDCHKMLIQDEEDRPEIAQKRIEWFQETSAPVVESFEKSKILRRVNGALSVEAVFRTISEKTGIEKWFAANN
ncbi:nucleoside monophosphate kinase [bacterium]|nr:nucleoside monophosphate kinase [bacterium]